MKKLLIIVLSALLFAAVSWADEITLNNPEALAPPTAVKIDFRQIKINLNPNWLELDFRFLDVNGEEILGPNGRTQRLWRCQNMIDNPTTPENEASTCFTDLFMFVIRAQDVGTPIGRGLRNLIWNKMKSDVLSGGNDGTFN